MPHATDESQPDGPRTAEGRRRLVLCFDGTGNKFQGTEGDTNVVKIYQMLEKHTPNQFHYYQPGIGTYTEGQSKTTSSAFNVWRKLKFGLVSTIDQAVGTSFEQHVLSGYRFIMRYYEEGDQIYIFGFSRGAYTARFLAEMIHDIGLLSRGNEEMVRFAWETFSNFQNSRGNDPQSDKDRELQRYMEYFKGTFCRPGISVHFLGLFDCVNSVGQFEIPMFRRSYKYIASPMARHIRHAISIHERRLKFKPALFFLNEEDKAKVDLKEMWFAGNHGDVGGGWTCEEGQKHLLSDTALTWMVQEVLDLDKGGCQLSFSTTNIHDIISKENQFPGKEKVGTSAYALRRRTNQPHDMLQFWHGVGYISVVLWWIIEVLPIFTRLELENGEWVPRYWPANFGASRDIPEDAEIHPSVKEMVQVGILDDMPRKGGNNSNLPDPLSIMNSWTRMRAKRSTDETNAESGDHGRMAGVIGHNGTR